MDSPENFWQDEARAVIKDVADYVKEIVVSPELSSSATQIYLNLTTLEDQLYTVELARPGFRVVGHRYDSIVENETSQFYETQYALLTTISPSFPACFASAIQRSLNLLTQN